MLDLTNLQQITDGNRAMLNSLLSEFVRTTDSDLKDLANAVSSQQKDLITRLSHRIKGAASIVGASELAELTGELETKGKQAHPDDSSELLNKIIDCYNDVSKEIDLYK
ncbi:hypothetical protein GZ77_12885 [Endozoicomonas montiporae]|uniref:HPt domain-containing protein n=2 Tax=Endozoicomonas montiporae TaxID=1027273 RepID=A0A081N4E6_9GAMM|nr:Hpt domain-containing protein [Endozoicomonas montiporae]AMO57834.1 Hpt domain-containing protein [Endozoicomonas montiporae CL-33]KEQ13319.1 hypothetical protein GZ77_12885 [Endozoicomonas montiporae]